MHPAGPFRVGLVGFGAAGAALHAPLIAATPGLTLAVVVTRDPDRAARVRAGHPGAEVVADTAALLARRPDLVVVASPNRTHAATAAAALDAGAAVVVDKPLARDAHEAAALVARAEPGRLGVFHNRRWDGDFLTLLDVVAAGTLGEIWRFESRFERWRPTPKTGWRELADPDEGGGVLADLGPHLVDQALVAFGPVRSVAAQVDTRRAGAVVDDDVLVALTHRSGVRSHLWMSAATAQPGPRFRVLGAAGGFTTWGMDGQEVALRSGSTGPGPVRFGTLGAGADLTPVPLRPGRYGGFYRAVVDALRDGTALPVPAADAVAGLEVIDAARRSAAGGVTVDLDGPPADPA